MLFPSAKYLVAWFALLRSGTTYHKKSPDGVVGEDGAGDNEHCEAYETVELVGVSLLACEVCRIVAVSWLFIQGCWRPFLT